jgi:hypothetical protein
LIGKLFERPREVSLFCPVSQIIPDPNSHDNGSPAKSHTTPAGTCFDAMPHAHIWDKQSACSARHTSKNERSKQIVIESALQAGLKVHLLKKSLGIDVNTSDKYQKTAPSHKNMYTTILTKMCMSIPLFQNLMRQEHLSRTLFRVSALLDTIGYLKTMIQYSRNSRL